MLNIYTCINCRQINSNYITRCKSVHKLDLASDIIKTVIIVLISVVYNIHNAHAVVHCEHCRC